MKVTRCFGVAAATSAGMLLMEFMIFIGVFMLVLSTAGTAFYQFHIRSMQLRRNTHDIERVLRAGEQWREEVRHASMAEMIPAERGEVLRLDFGTNEIFYGFQSGRVWRKSSPEAPWGPFLNNVKSSVMARERRDACLVWHWELELQAAQKAVRQRPLFSFLAVPGLRREEGQP